MSFCPPGEERGKFGCLDDQLTRRSFTPRGLLTMRDQFSKFLSGPPVRAGYCVDCLSQLYSEPVETIGGYLGEIRIASRQAHCGSCGEHKDIFMALLPPKESRAK
jgi:hypothetical protein